MKYALNVSNLFGAELAIAFAGIPAGVTTLGFNKSDLHDKNGVIRTGFLFALPNAITNIIVDRKSFHPAEYLLNQILPIEQRGRFYDDFHDEALIDNPIKPKFDIDEKMLVNLIHYFQNHPSPIGYLACALLLDFRILNLIDKRLENNQHHFENRVVGAIDFYRRAACDAALKPKIEHILWGYRTIYPESLIANKLTPFKLSPNCETYFSFEQDTREGLLDITDDSEKPVNVLHILRENSSLIEPIYSFWLKLKIVSAISASIMMVTLLCLNASLVVAAASALVVTTLTYASCRFFVQTEQSSQDSAWQLIHHL